MMTDRSRNPSQYDCVSSQPKLATGILCESPPAAPAQNPGAIGILMSLFTFTDLATCTAYIAKFLQTADQLGIPPECRDALAQRVADELPRQLPTFVKMLTILASLDELYRRAHRTFRRAGFRDGHHDPFQDAEIQASNVTAQIVKAFSGNWCRTHAGAWVARIRTNVFGQALRGGKLQRDRLGQPNDPAVLQSHADRNPASDFLAGLTEQDQHAIELFYKGRTEAEIAATLGESSDVVRATIRRVCDRLC